MRKTYEYAIATSDWHITALRPDNRQQGYVTQQFNKIKYILDLCRKHSAVLLNAGDLFDRARVPRWLEQKYFRLFFEYQDIQHTACAGQHDQIYHSANLQDTSIQQFFSAGFLQRGGDGIVTADWGTNIDKKKGIVVSHTCCTEKPNPFIDYSVTSDQLLAQTQADLIVTGDYHKAHYNGKVKGRLVVNPGSIMRIGSDEMKKKPSVYVIDLKNMTIVEQIFLPVLDAAKVFDKDGIIKQKEEKAKAEDLRKRFDGYLEKVDEKTVKPDFDLVLGKVIQDVFPSEEVKLEIDDILGGV